MANLPEISQFEAGVYQIETTDPVLGGPNGVTNLPLKHLTNRTRFLKDQVDELRAGAFVPPGVATEAFVTGAINRQDIKSSVRVATTGNINLTGIQTIDGVALVDGDRVLVKNQTAGQLNGIYVVSSSAWLRSTDADASTEVTAGMLVLSSEGMVNADRVWKLTTNDPITLNTTPLVFADITDGFAPLASPAFTGNPTAPTQAQFDADASLATTAFVQRALGNHQSALTFTGNQTLVAADAGKVYIYAEPVNATITLPLFDGVPVGAAFEFVNTGPNILTITRAGTDQIDVGTATVNSIDVGPGQSLRLIRAAATLLWHAVTVTAAPVPTPPQFDNDQSVATTAFVQRALGNHQSAETFTASITLAPGDAGKCYVFTGAAAATATLPLVANTPIGAAFEFLNTGTATLTVSRAGTDNIDNGPASVTSIAIPPNQSLRLVRAVGSSLWHAVTFPTASLAGAFQSVLTDSGYQRLPSGLIIQWGRKITPTGNNQTDTTTYPIAFPAGTLAVCVAPEDPNVNAPAYILGVIPSSTGFVVYLRGGSPAQFFNGAVYRYMAIGV